MNTLKKYCMLALLSIFCVFCLSSCKENENYKSYQPQEGVMFVCVESYIDPYLGDVKILVDKETRIMYIRYYESEGDDKYSGMTVLYDNEGKPKKYSGVIAN